LDQALRLLDPSARALWQELSDGKRLCDLPQLLGVSYRTLKRRWRNLREQLISAFRYLKEREEGSEKPMPWLTQPAFGFGYPLRGRRGE
jgi:hypothetical protein